MVKTGLHLQRLSQNQNWGFVFWNSLKSTKNAHNHCYVSTANNTYIADCIRRTALDVFASCAELELFFVAFGNTQNFLPELVIYPWIAENVNTSLIWCWWRRWICNPATAAGRVITTSVLGNVWLLTSAKPISFDLRLRSCVKYSTDVARHASPERSSCYCRQLNGAHLDQNVKHAWVVLQPPMPIAY